MPEYTRCICKLRDCYYWNPVPGGTEEDCNCAHPDKPHYMQQPCPLYKKEFPTDQASELRERFMKKRQQNW